MTPKQQAYKTLANTMIKNFAKRNMEAFYCETKEEVVALAMDLMKDAKTVGMGGTESVKECGLLDAVKASETLHFIDRNLATTPEERKALIEKILEENPNVNETYLETLADYLIIAIEKKEKKEGKRKALTENRQATIAKREISFEGLAA